MVRLTPAQTRQFRSVIYTHFKKHGRNLPWRQTNDPYRILVSEIMLQQTQVPRVLQKYQMFIKHFPTLRALATAPLAKVLQAWQGLGYNRRALALRTLAQQVVSTYGGKLPDNTELLDELPGIGKHTAGSIAAFAFNKPTVFIETNIRSVYIHFFFQNRRQPVTDEELLPLIHQTLDRKNPRQWYNALMDYGVFLKKQFKNPGRRSAHYAKQSTFEGSNRQVRGQILKALIVKKQLTLEQLMTLVPTPPQTIHNNLRELQNEGFVSKNKGFFAIA